MDLDNSQYRLYKEIWNIGDKKLRAKFQRIYLQCLLAFHQLHILLETIEADPNADVREKLVDWIGYSNDLIKHAINSLDPESKTRGASRPQHSLEEIASYQNTTEDDIKAAVEDLLDKNK